MNRRSLLGVLIALAIAGGVQAGVAGAATTFVVNTASDSTSDGVCDDDDCTLRDAIDEANATPGADVINFKIGVGLKTITPLTPLPQVTDPVTIDGTTQPASGGVIIVGGPPRIELDGSTAGTGDGLLISAGASTVKGLIINGFVGGAGIHLITNGANVVTGNFIGTSSAGTAAVPNGNGVEVESPNNTIGGTNDATRNLISGNGGANVWLKANGNVVKGNYIGPDLGLTAALSATARGVLIANASNNTIGGTASGAGNVLSGNAFGVHITASTAASGNLIQGNLIGIGNKGDGLANQDGGVVIDNGSTNTVGGTTAGARNVISGNAGFGVRIVSAGAGGNLVQGNYIGLKADGTTALGNAGPGVEIALAAHDNTVGGTAAGAGNVISATGTFGTGTLADGVFIHDPGTTGNRVQANLIGTDSTGTSALGNTRFGVHVLDATSNTIGGAVAGARNVISANGSAGVEIDATSPGGTAANNLVQGNFVGTDAAGSAVLGTQAVGVFIFNAGGVTVGGTTALARNVIVGSAIDVQIRDETGLAAATGNVVRGNFIGTNATGNAGLAATSVGVLVQFATNTTIGGAVAGARNVISGHAGNFGIQDETSTGTKIQGNFIGTNAAGTGPVPNGGDGVRLNDATNVLIGGTTGAARNVISGNQNGIQLTSSVPPTNPWPSATTIQGNFIGTNAAGTAPINTSSGDGNIGNGIFIDPGVQGVTIGGTVGGAGNRISYSGLDGVMLGLAGATTDPQAQAAIEGNVIYLNADEGIDLNDDGITANDPGDGDAGANDLQNFPVLTSATTAGLSNATGTLNSTVSTNFRIELFANAACNDVPPKDFGEGERLVGAINVTTDASGNASFSIPLVGLVASGDSLTATATDIAGNKTSEFSKCMTVTGGAGATATGDFNGDGFSDLAIGVPGEDLGAVANAGAVNVIYGSSPGLNATTVPDQLWTQDSTGVLETAEAGDAFGAALSAGDINGDGKADLVIGVPGEDVGATLAGVNAGAFQVLRGSPTGLVSANNQLFVQAAPERNDFFGAALTRGDFNGDGKADAAVGSPGEDVGTIVDGGQVNVYAGSATGLSTTAQVWTQDSTNVEDSVETGDRFGSSLTSGDFNGDTPSRSDLAIGVPGEDLTALDAGAVNVLFGSAAGLSAFGDQLLTATTPAAADGFGSALGSGDLNGDAKQDLAVGLPGNAVGVQQGAGAVGVFLGAAAGFPLTPSMLLTQNSTSIAGVSEAGDVFGSAVAIGDFNNDGKGDLAVGVPGEDLPGSDNGGAVNVVYGSATGPTPAGNRLFTQDSTGIADQVERGDQFGSSLTVGRFNTGAAADLAVGVPSEDIGAVLNAGAVSVLYGALTTGLNTANQFWSQNAPNIEDDPEAGDGFGWALG